MKTNKQNNNGSVQLRKLYLFPWGQLWRVRSGMDERRIRIKGIRIKNNKNN